MPTPPSPEAGGIHIGDVGGSVNFSALGDIVGGNKITNITTTIQISVEAITQKPLVIASPYRGLDRFEDRDRDLFFGRDQLIKSLLAQLSGSNVLLVLGASGSGKSSVIRAGLLPALAELIGPRFRYFTFVPDANPFESLRSALHGAGFTQSQTRPLLDAQPDAAARLIQSLQREGDQWLVFVDQFEEIFTTTDESLRRSFIAALLAIAKERNSPVKLVLAMRADFLDRFSPFPEFAKVIEKNIDFVADMHGDELRLAIEQPAARNGAVFEQGLVEEIIRDVEGQAGSLPLLQYTLALLWEEERRSGGLEDRHLNTRVYRELGGVRGALQKRADEIYAAFADGGDAKAASPKQEIVRRIFLQLVDVAGESGNDAAWRPVRRRTPISQFAGTGEAEIVRALIDEKLLVSNREGEQATVEVAHEALFTSWERLRKWIEGGKQVIFVRNRLADDARRWQRRKDEHDSGADEELLSGSRLSQALDLRGRGDFVTVVGGLSDLESRFLDQSMALREKRAKVRRQLEIAGFALLVLAIFGAVFGWVNQRKAATEARNSKRVSSQSDFLRATDLLAEKKTHEALAYLARACRTDPENSVAATRLFSLLVQRNWVIPVTEKVPHTDLEGLYTPALERVLFHPDGRTFVTTTFSDGQARIWETETRRLRLGPVPCNTGGFHYESQPPMPDERSFSAKEPLLLIARDKQVRIADFGSGKIRDPILEHESNVRAMQFIPDGARILTGDDSGKIQRWNARIGTPDGQSMKLPSAVIALSRDGNRAVSGSSEEQGEAAEGKESGIQIWTLNWTTGKADAIDLKLRGKFLHLSDDGQRACTYTLKENDLTEIHFWDIAKRVEQSQKLDNTPADPEFIERVSSSRDSRYLVTAGYRRSTSDFSDLVSFATGQMRIWDMATGTQTALIRHQSMQMNPTEGYRPYRAALSLDAVRLASLAFQDHSLRISSPLGNSFNEPPCANAAFSDAVFHPEGKSILTGSVNGSAQIWDIQPTSPISVPVRIPGVIKDWPVATNARFSKDGKRLALNDEKGRTICYELETGKVINPVPAEFTALVPDGEDPTGKRRFELVPQAGSESPDGPLRMVDAATGKPIVPEVKLNSGSRARFSEDGQRLLLFVPETELPLLKILDAKTGMLLREAISDVYDAWFSPKGDRILLKQGKGLTVLDMATGRELIDPLSAHHIDVAAFTADGLMTMERRGDDALIHRFRFHLDHAPTVLPKLAEIIGQHALNESGVPVERSAIISDLRALAATLNESDAPPLFAAWLKWFVSPRETRPIAPDTKVTMAEYLAQLIEEGTPESLNEAELLAFGDKELLPKIAAKRAKLKSGDPQ